MWIVNCVQPILNATYGWDEIIFKPTLIIHLNIRYMFDIPICLTVLLSTKLMRRLTAKITSRYAIAKLNPPDKFNFYSNKIRDIISNDLDCWPASN